MALIPGKELEKELAKKESTWVPEESWIYHIPDAQRQNLLGVAIDRADLAAIFAKAATQPPMVAPISLPMSVDWRSKNGHNYISPVKNQGGCGSCVSFCSCAVVEAMAMIEKGGNFLDLSEADLHFCSAHGANCGGWWPTNAFDDLKTRGVVPESAFPYNSAFHNGAPQCLPVPDRAHVVTKITSYTSMVAMVDLKSWLAANGPLSAIFHVYDDFFGYRSGVYKHVTGGEAGYHCVEVVGYSDTEHCWICKNSWADTWGDHGFFKIAYGECGIDETSVDKDSQGNILHFPMWGAHGVILPAPVTTKISAVDADINSDGRLETFVIALSNRSVWHMWQMNPHAGPWSGWNSLGGKVKAIKPSRNSDGRLEVLAIGMDDSLWTIWQIQPNSGWSGWASLGGKIKQVGTALNVDGRLEAFGIGMDDALWNIWQTAPHSGPWSQWNPLAAGHKIKALCPSCNSDGRLEVFCIGLADDGLFNIWQTVPHSGPWSSMNSLGGKVKQIDAELNSDGRLEVFGIGMDDALWNTWQTASHSGPWSGWNSLGGKVKRISSTRNSDGRLEVLGIGMDDGLWNIWQMHPHAGPWSGWNKLA